MADAKKYLTGNTTGDEQVAEDDSFEEDNFHSRRQVLKCL